MIAEIDPIISLITSSEIQRALLPVKIGFIFFTVFFAVGIIFYLSKTELLKEVIFRDFARFFFGQTYGARKFIRQWEKVKERVERGTQSEWKLSIMEADDMLDDILTKMGVAGATIEERLRNAKKDAPGGFDFATKAHTVRDNVVHDPDYQLTKDEARDTLDIYEKTFQDLEAFS